MVYEKIMRECKDFVNTELIEISRKIGKENCYIVTNGEQEFNRDKIKYSGIGNLFKEIFIVPGTKKDVIRDICNRYKDEEVIFIDDKGKFIDDINLKKCPNLKTILYSSKTSKSLDLVKSPTGSDDKTTLFWRIK